MLKGFFWHVLSLDCSRIWTWGVGRSELVNFLSFFLSLFVSFTVEQILFTQLQKILSGWLLPRTQVMISMK